MRLHIGTALTIAVISLLSALFLFACLHREEGIPIFSSIKDNQLLLESWNAYKKRFIQSDGRVIDWSLGEISTSEGQSYALLRSVWMDDREAFDKILNWTSNNLKKKENHLFAWKWGKGEDGSWEIMDHASAADGDQDIAFTLILAYNRWGDDRHREAAANIIKDIWSYETVEIKGKRYVVAGDWVRKEREIIINPSYQAPYAYRLFSALDTSHNWGKVLDSSYDIIYRCSRSSRLFLPPDWCKINRKEEVILPAIFDKKGDTSYDAFRVYWRLALDYAWFGEKRASEYIKRSDLPLNYWNIKKSIASSYTRDGIPGSDGEALSIYGMLLPSFVITDPKSAEDLYKKKILLSYRNGFWGESDGYYTQNWVWIGIALYQEIKEGKK